MTTITSAPPAKESKFGLFAITFGIAYVLLYTIFERLNWPLFTYHPAVGKIDFWMQPARSGEGPPMYWYGWLALSAIAALAVASLATLTPRQWIYRGTIFACVLAALWPALLALASLYADNASFNADFLKSVWLWAAPAAILAAVAAYATPQEWAERLWTGWLLIVPIVGLVVLGYSLLPWFTR